MKLQAFLIIVICALVQEGSSVSKIINGELASEGQFPHMVQLSIRKKESTKFCGGNLLDADWVLTAAHCIKDMISAKAYLGSVFMRTMLLKLKIVDASMHPDYKNINANDIALVKLEKSVSFSEIIQPIKLPARHQTPTDTFINSTLFVTGFGETKNGSQSNLYLRFVKMQAITGDDCSKEWGWKMRETLICARGHKNLNQTTCNGDSGNGLIAETENEMIVYGIASYGAPGCLGKPKVFTRIASYLDYIHSVTGIEIKN